MRIRCVDERSSINIDLKDVIYFEAMGDDLFCITEKGKFKSKLKLYETEDFGKYGFIRISKSFVVNVFHIITLTPMVNSKLKVRMKNKDVLYINRTYIKTFKQFLKKGEFKHD